MTAGSLGSAQAEIIIDIDQAMAALSTLQSRLAGMGNVGANAFDGANKGLKSLTERADAFDRKFNAIGKTLLGFGAITAVAFGTSVSKAASFEKQMDAVGAVLNLTTEQAKAFSAEALRIGSTTSVGANDAGAAMEAMAKAGVPLEAILNGGAQGAVNLAEATGEPLAQSADTMSNMLNLFAATGITGKEATDILVNGMNASSATMSEFQTGIARLAPTIAGMGLSFEESAAAIAFWNAKGLSAAEVGTSLNAVTTSLIGPTDEMAQAQHDLGVEAFDAQGKFVGYPTILDQIQKGTAGMNDEDRAAILNKAFLQDAQDLLNISVKDGGDGLADYEKRMGKTGTAADASAKRMDNFAGSIEQLRGTLETLQITIGTKFLPLLRPLVDGLTQVLQGFLNLDSTTQTVVAAIVGVTGALAGLTGGTLLAIPKIMRFVAALDEAGISLAAIAGPLLLIIAILGLLALAYATNFGGFRDAVNAAAATVGKFFSDLFSWFQIFKGQGMGNVMAAFSALGLMLESITGIPLFDYFQKIGKAILRFPNALKKIEKGLDRTFRSLFEGDWNGVIKNLGLTSRGIGDLLAAPAKLVGDALKGITTGFEPLDTLLHNLGKVWTDFGRLIQEVFQGDWAGALDVGGRLLGHFVDFISSALSLAWSGIKAGVGALFDYLSGVDWGGVLDTILGALGDLGSALWGWITDAVGSIDWLGVWDTVVDVTTTIVSKLGDLGLALITWVVDAVGGINWAGAWETVTDVTGTIIGKLGDLSLAVITWVVDAVAGVNWAGAWETVVDVTGTIVGKLGDLGLALIGWVVDAVGAINWAGAWETVVDVTATIIGKLGDLVTAVWDWVSGAVSGIDWSAIWALIPDQVSAVVSAIFGAAGDLAAAIWTCITDAIPDDWSAAFEGVSVPDIPGVEETCAALDLLRQAFDLVADGAYALSAGLKWLIDQFSKLTWPEVPVEMEDLGSVLDVAKDAAYGVAAGVKWLIDQLGQVTWPEVPASMEDLRDVLSAIANFADTAYTAMANLAAKLPDLSFPNVADIPGLSELLGALDKIKGWVPFIGSEGEAEVQQMPELAGVTIPPPEHADFDTEMGKVQTLVDDFEDATYTASLNADIAITIAAYNNAKGTYGDVWESSVYTADLAADYQKTIDAFESAGVWGAGWENSTYTAAFSAETSGVTNAYENALELGRIWAQQTFTAKFNITQQTTVIPPTTTPTAGPSLFAAPAVEGPLLLASPLAAGIGSLSASPFASLPIGGAGRFRGMPVGGAKVPIMSVTVHQQNYALSAADLQHVLDESELGGGFARNFTTELDLRRNG